MAVQSKTDTWTTTKPIIESDSFQYGFGVTTTKWIDGQLKFVCSYSGQRTNPKRQITQTVYFRRESRKNVPYLPSRDRLPLAYLVDTRLTNGPGAVVSSPFVQSAGDNKALCEGSPPPVTSCAVTCSNPAGLTVSYLEPSSSTRNAAIAKMHDKIEEQKTIHANYAVFAGEFKKSLAMVAQNTNDILRCYRNLRKGRFSAAYSALFGRKRRETFDPLHQKWRYSKRKDKRTADALWLEWTYGWVPLVSESYAIIGDLRMRKANFLVRATGRAREDQNSVVKTTLSGSLGRNAIVFDVDVEQVRTVDLRYTCWYKLTNQYWSDLAASGITDPLSVAWELVPFSFVADWFVNVGDYLRAQTIGRGWTFMYGCESKKQTLNHTVAKSSGKFDSKGSQADEWWTGKFVPVYSRTWSKFTRTILTGPPTMTLSINARIHSLNRIISSAALLKQLSRR